MGPAEGELPLKSCGNLRQEGGPWVSELVRRRRTNSAGLVGDRRKLESVRQCWANSFALLVELPETLQAGSGRTPDSRLAKPNRHAGEEPGAVLRPINALLLVLHDEPSEQLVPHDE